MRQGVLPAKKAILVAAQIIESVLRAALVTAGVPYFVYCYLMVSTTNRPGQVPWGS